MIQMEKMHILVLSTVMYQGQCLRSTFFVSQNGYGRFIFGHSQWDIWKLLYLTEMNRLKNDWNSGTYFSTQLRLYPRLGPAAVSS